MEGLWDNNLIYCFSMANLLLASMGLVVTRKDEIKKSSRGLEWRAHRLLNIYCNVILGNGIHIHLCRKVLLATILSWDDDDLDAFKSNLSSHFVKGCLVGSY